LRGKGEGGRNNQEEAAAAKRERAPVPLHWRQVWQARPRE
jgi:hypothetical protein